MNLVTLNKHQLENILADYFGPYVCITNANSIDRQGKVRRAKLTLGGQLSLYFVATRKSKRSSK